MVDVNAIMFPGAIAPNVSDISLKYVEGYPIMYFLSERSSFTILFFHGNGDTIQNVWLLFKKIGEVKFGNETMNKIANIVCPEYCGYGIRSGKENDKCCEKMADKICKWTIEEFKCPIIIVGYSIGTGPATYVANKYQDKIYGLVLINPFKSIQHLAFEMSGIFAGFIRQRFPNHKRLKKYESKIIIIAGEKDEIIPFTHSISLYDICTSSDKRIFIQPGMGHGIDDWIKRVIEPIFASWFTY